MFGVVRQKYGFIIRKKENWMQEQSVDIFIGYPKKSKGYMFYCPNHSMRIVETRNERFIENGEINVSIVP